MPRIPLSPPSMASSITTLVDWLELIAFTDEFGTSRLDALVGSLEQQEEEQDEDISARDIKWDAVREAIENEVDARARGCAGHYPFELSDDGEELRLIAGWEHERYKFYLVCLLTSHLTGSPIVDVPIDEALIARLRNRVFQIVSVFTMAGLARGSAASIGWPREAKDTIIQVLKRTEGRGSGITTKAVAGEYKRPSEKDGGIDVISWSIGDRPPPILFYYAQAASGNNWRGKPVMHFVEGFERNYMDDGPRGNRVYATLIPFREPDFKTWYHEHLEHKTLLDRTRIPRHGWEGVEMSRNGIEMDESANLPQVTAWVEDMRVFLSA